MCVKIWYMNLNSTLYFLTLDLQLNFYKDVKKTKQILHLNKVHSDSRMRRELALMWELGITALIEFYLLGEQNRKDLNHHLNHPFTVTLRIPLFRQMQSMANFKGTWGSNVFCSLFWGLPHQFHFHPATPGRITISLCEYDKVILWRFISVSRE